MPSIIKRSKQDKFGHSSYQIELDMLCRVDIDQVNEGVYHVTCKEVGLL